MNITIEDNLLQMVTIAAARCGMKQREWVIATLEAAVKDEVLEPLGNKKEIAREKKASGLIEDLGPCPHCGGRLVTWALGKARCTKCARMTVVDFKEATAEEEDFPR